MFGKDAYVNLFDGRPIRLAFQLEDKAPPTFGGLLSATPVSATRIDLAWSPASDLVATTANIVYLVYMATTSGGESFSSPSFTTSAGATTYSVTGLNPNTTYSFVVRADDGAGNREVNTIEKSARTLQPPDITPPQFAGLKSAVASATNSGRVDLSWSAASDNVTIAAGIVYRIYMATTPGGENFAAPSFTSSVGATAYSVTGLNPDTTYFFVVRVR